MAKERKSRKNMKEVNWQNASHPAISLANETFSLKQLSSG